MINKLRSLSNGCVAVYMVGYPLLEILEHSVTYDSLIDSIFSAKRKMAVATTTTTVGGDGGTVFLVGINNSKEAFCALQWTLRHHFSADAKIGAASKLVIVYAKPTPSSVIGIGGLGCVDVLPYVESNLTEIAAGVIQEARELCAANTVSNVVFEVIEGEASAVLCEAVEKFHADMLVLGSYGHVAIKRALLGSVKDYCVHYAKCSVMVVKKPMDQK